MELFIMNYPTEQMYIHIWPLLHWFYGCTNMKSDTVWKNY